VSCRFDDVDVRIMKSLSEDCRKSTTQVAKEAGVSRPTAIARMRNLADNRLVDFGAKVNVEKLGFKLAILILESDTAEGKGDLVKKLAACPRVLQLVRWVDKPNYTAVVCAESAETLLSAIECLRGILSARISSWQRIKPILGKVFNLKIFLEKCELTPCGKKCGICPSYQESECVGCPTTKDYTGRARGVSKEASKHPP